MAAFEAGGLRLQLWQDAYHTPYAKVMAMLVLVAKLHLQDSDLSPTGNSLLCTGISGAC